MIKYEVIIYWSEEDDAFIAEVPELPGCAAHGATQDSALGVTGLDILDGRVRFSPGDFAAVFPL